MWLFDDLVMPTGLLHAPAGVPRDQQRNVAATYEDFRPGTYDQAARLADMTLNHVEAAINYPNIFPRFAGQGFLERADKDLALTCLRIYNDWMIDDWCGGAGKGRLIPLTLVPLWDPAARRRRGAALRRQGQLRHRLQREPLEARRARRCTPASGTSSGRPARRPTPRCRCTSARRRRMPTTSDDAPLATSMSLYAQNAQGSLCDWVFSGIAPALPRRSRSPTPRARSAGCRSSSSAWTRVWRDGRGGVDDVTVAPSEQVHGRVYGCVFDDLHGLINREAVGLDHILFETDYPHSDGTFPHSRKVAHELFVAAGMDAEDCYKVLRGNAIEAYGLQRFGITK